MQKQTEDESAAGTVAIFLITVILIGAGLTGLLVVWFALTDQ